MSNQPLCRQLCWLQNTFKVRAAFATIFFQMKCINHAQLSIFYDTSYRLVRRWECPQIKSQNQHFTVTVIVKFHIQGAGEQMTTKSTNVQILDCKVVNT